MYFSGMFGNVSLSEICPLTFSLLEKVVGNQLQKMLEETESFPPIRFKIQPCNRHRAGQWYSLLYIPSDLLAAFIIIITFLLLEYIYLEVCLALILLIFCNAVFLNLPWLTEEFWELDFTHFQVVIVEKYCCKATKTILVFAIDLGLLWDSPYFFGTVL